MRERSRTRLKAATLVTLVASGILACCHDNGHKPVPAEYLLYAGVHGGGGSGNAYVAIIDCQTDSIVDSFPVPAEEVLALTASGDGKYIATNGRQIWDARTHSLVADLWPPFLGEVFLPGGREFLSPDFDSTLLYSIPEFSRIGVIATELWDGTRWPGRSLVIGIDNRGHHETPGPNLLRVLDYETREIVDSIVIAPDPGEHSMVIGKFELSPDGSRLYALGVTARGDQLVGYDLQRREVLFRRWVYSYWGQCRVTPDGKEVWLTDAGELGFPDLWPPYIIILDALTGAPLDSISMRGFYPDSISGYEHRSLEPQSIRFLPTGEKAYVNCGRYFSGHAQPLLVIDTRKREVIKLLFDSRSWTWERGYDFDYLIESIDLGPKP